MRNFIRRTAAALAVLCMAALLLGTPTEAEERTYSAGGEAVGYYAGWAAYQGFTPDQIPAEHLTQINYAFAQIDPDTLTIALENPAHDQKNLAALRKLRQQNQHLKLLISVGGWSDSQYFSDAAATAARRESFAASCVDFVVEQGLDVGFAYDGDADRCLAVDERGRVVDGDQILYVCGVYLNKHGSLSGGTVVPTIASNFGLIKSLELAGLSAVTSGVGDRHVYAKMREGGYSLGGEQTGHTIFGDIERTGDGIMTSLRLMEVIRAEREMLSQLAAPCKLLPQAQVAVHVADKDAALENMGVQNAIAEAEAALAGEGRVLVRKSGTESVIRVLAEAPDQAAADAAMKRIAAALEAL